MDKSDIPFVFALIALVTSVTGVDFVVHNVLYKWGLIFSWDWALPYWISLYFIIISSSLFAVSSFYVPRKDLEEIPSHIKIKSLLIGLSTLFAFSNLDLIWFCMAGYLPPFKEIWWWMPQSFLLGLRWNSLAQIIFTTVIDVGIGVAWYLAD